MSENKKKSIRGIRIRTVSYVMIFLSVILYLVLFFANNKVSKEYEVAVISTEDYIKCDAQVSEIMDGSNYLTQQIQLYVMTGNREYVDDYFEEITVRKRRKHALQALEEYKILPHTYQFLEDALAQSNQLMEREIYAIKLIALAQKADLHEFPETVQNLVLSEEDRNLTPEQMQEKARTMVFDTAYQEVKARIASNISYFVNEAISNTIKINRIAFLH